MSETLKHLAEETQLPILRRILKQFGDISVEENIVPGMTNAEIFRKLTKNHGAGKPHCGKYYVRQEGKIKSS
ncbi:MAG: hypothetical protein WC784_02395 [Candidatus Shapirobacteria bacterium]|jgi:hypothetical protein